MQISTSKQFIVNYTIHSNPTDTLTLKSHLEQHKNSYGKTPETLTADAGYGSEENYTLLEQKGIRGYVKYNMFDKGQHKTYTDKSPFHADKLFYQQENDAYICPMGQQMQYSGDTHRISGNGFLQTYKRYQARNCSTCPLNGVCHKSQTNRIIEINVNLKRQKQRAEEPARKGLSTESDGVMMSNRSSPISNRVPPLYAPGKEKVEIEWGLLAIAQNLSKKAV